MKQKLLLFLSVLLTTAGAWAQTAYDGVYTMQVDENQKRGYVAAGEGYAGYPILSDITLSGYENNSTPAIENGKNWYITSTNAGESYYIYNVALGKFLVGTGSQINFGDTPYLWKIYSYSNGSYLNIEDVSNSGKFLSGGCGRTAPNRPMAYDRNNTDGGALYTLTEVADGVSTFANAIAMADCKIFLHEILTSGREVAFRNSDLASSVRVNAFLSVDLSESRAHGTKTLNRYGIWRLESANAGAFYIYNIEQKGYLKTPSDNCRFVADKAEAAQYTFEIVDAATNKVELKCNDKTQTLHLNNHSDGLISDYDRDDAASRWYVLDETDPEIGLFLALASDETQNYFSDGLYSELKDGVTSGEGIANAELETLVASLLSNAEGYKKFRVAEYEPYRTVASLQRELKTSAPYNKWENPTGIYLKEGENCVVAVSGIGEDPVGLKIKNWVTNQNESSYSLVNGLNNITATSEGNVFVDYYTDNYKTAGNVTLHFINAPVRGYWDQQTMDNEDWTEMLGKLESDNSVIVVRSEHAQLAYPVSAWKSYCPEDVDCLMTLYQQVQWAQRDMMGLEKYGREAKNRQLFYATNGGFMAAGEDGAYCNVGSLKSIMTPDSKVFDFWGVGHEWGHNNQIDGFHWSGCGETTNNIYASWGQIRFTGNPSYLRLEDEVTGIDEYAGMRGGRMQTYFEEGLRKGVQWQLQDGPDYHGATPDKKTVTGQDYNGNNTGQVTTTSRNYDHFVKLSPFWQLNLWGTLADKCPDIIPMVIESIRTTENYTSIYNTNGKQQINWMKLACDNAQIDLLPFFEKAGMLKPINAYIEDYGAGWNKINEEMIANLKSYVASKRYPAFNEEINYINGHNYHIYRDNQKLSVPGTLGEGCEQLVGKVKVDHNMVKNAVAFETFNSAGELIRITMYGLGSDDAHSYTQVLYPGGAAYIMAVGYDGTRERIYERRMVNVVYSFTFKGEEKMREENACAVGDVYPEITSTFPFGISATKPEGTIQVEGSDATVTMVIELQENLPFKYATSYKEIEKWYHLKFGANSYYISHDASINYIKVSAETRPVDNWEAYQWAFVGNPFDGYKIYNKATGEASILSSSTTMSGTTGAGTWAVMTSAPVPEGNNEYWYATASTHGTNGFYLAQKGYNNNRLNNRDGNLAYWTDGADGGSTFTVENVLPMPVRLSANDKTYYYALKSGRGDAYWYTYDSTDGKIALSANKGADTQLWFFKGLYQDGKLCVQLYPKADFTKAMSYEDTGSGPAKIVAKAPGTNGWKNTWKIVDTNGAAPYGLITPGDKNYNYLSNWGGTGNKMGMWTAAPEDDGGTAIYIYQTIDNIITDMAGNTYQSTSFAQVGEQPEPTFAGAEGYSLNNKCWIDNKFTADIDFGFPVSKQNGLTNATMIRQGSWEKATAPKKWHAVLDGGKYYVKVKTQTKTTEYVPSVSEVTSWLWAIYPQYDNDNGAFSFSVKNINTGTYVAANTSVIGDYQGNKKPISLDTTPTYFTIKSRDGGKMFSYKAGENLDSNHYLTINSENDVNVFLGSYTGTHAGNDINFLSASYTVGITSAKAATLFTPIAVSIPEGVTAKYVKAEGDNIGSEGRLLYTKLNGIIPANTAVVLTGEEGTYTFLETKETGEQVKDNVLFGYAENTAVGESEHTATGEDGTVYALAKKDKGVAFYHYVGANYLAGKAYLDVKDLSAGTGVRLFNIFDEETETGVTETESEHVKTEIYDLTGRRVREARNGLYIVNGKRVIR